MVKSEAPSLGRLPVPHSRHSTVELAIGTLRHHLLPMVRTGAPFPDRGVAVLPFAPSALVRGSMVGDSKGAIGTSRQGADGQEWGTTIPPRRQLPHSLTAAGLIWCFAR